MDDDNMPAENDSPADETAKPETPENPNPGPQIHGAIPEHVPDPKDMVADRTMPDGRGVARRVQHNHPVLGGVEGNIAVPVQDAPIAFPFDRMGVGDSFEFEGIGGDKVLDAAKKWASEGAAGHEYEVHDHAGKERIWRVR